MPNKSIWMFLQFLLLILLSIFSGMTYWSFLVQEQTLLRQEELLKKIRQEIVTHKQFSTSAPDSMGYSPESRSQIQENLPNLLSQDPFIVESLPRIRKGMSPKGTFRQGVLGKPDDLCPFYSWADVADWYALCVGSLAKPHVGLYDTFGPSLASKIEKREFIEKGYVEYWVHLQDKMYWQPLEQSFFSKAIRLSDHFLNRYPVEAEDFLFYWNALHNPQVDFFSAVSLRALLSPLKEMRVIDSKTFFIRVDLQKNEDGKMVVPFDSERMIYSLQPLPRWVYLYHWSGEKMFAEQEVRSSSSFAQHFSRHFALNTIVSCGPWSFNGMTEEGISFKRNSSYQNPYEANWENIYFRFYNSPDALFRDFAANNLDVIRTPLGKLSELKRLQDANKSPSHSVEKIIYPERAYFFVGLNMKNPLLSSKKIRQALDYALDKKRIIEQVLNKQGSLCTGPFLNSSNSSDPSIQARPYSPLMAKQLLDEDGWKEMNGQGILEKEINGVKVPLSFSLIYIADSPLERGVCELISLQLKEIGVDCRIRGVKIHEISQAMDEKTFDACYRGWRLSPPPENMEQGWSSKQAGENGSANIVAFSNREVDHLIERLKLEDDEAKRIELYRKIHSIIADETPYIFLFNDVRTLAFWSEIDMIFVPKDRQDLCPGAVDPVPEINYSWKS